MYAIRFKNLNMNIYYLTIFQINFTKSENVLGVVLRQPHPPSEGKNEDIRIEFDNGEVREVRLIQMSYVFI